MTLCLLVISVTNKVMAHEATATYLANEAILIENDGAKVLFDPFFHKTFGVYQPLLEHTKQAVFESKPPFNEINVIAISHAHADHFAADVVLEYLLRYPDTLLVAPEQAIVELQQLPGAENISKQLVSVKLDFNDPPKTLNIAGFIFEAVRIPHAGWPGRADIQNIVWRVTFKNNDSPVTIMHMGDADPNDDHYIPYKKHWQSRQTDTAFPPYWFYSSAEGEDILSDIINAKHSIGIHVPMDVPKQLKAMDKDYFSKPGESRKVVHQH